MSRVNSFFLVLFALSSVCFGATLMQMTVSLSSNALQEIKTLADCDNLFGYHNQERTAAQLYERAFQMSFYGHMQKAEQASTCSSLLRDGSLKWAHETKDWINMQ